MEIPENLKTVDGIIAAMRDEAKMLLESTGSDEGFSYIADLLEAAAKRERDAFANQHEKLRRIIGELLPIARTEFCRLTEISFSILRTHPNDKELIGEIGDVLKDMIRLFDEAEAVIKNEGAK